MTEYQLGLGLRVDEEIHVLVAPQQVQVVFPFHSLLLRVWSDFESVLELDRKSVV